ncbi:hypothetical protein I7I51_07349 [Histoplasma capsulatum]|uniref:Uncharacterized protein n=1 Tax=Ajellomyces capsulatus TaxID=5037 RepID=A0A8A1MPC2_AJECA|nr:predicted protein [Histoplasma mississippiense (nom. inval.)]EDN06615.1 predicted protein [Histoplasma mississippiense (nom. inval.)]QSS66492.1 hypothetical protein I7I51_07349 [Histoplasma capsulatum]
MSDTHSLSNKLSNIKRCYLDIENQKTVLQEENNKVLRTLSLAERGCLNQIREVEAHLRALERKYDQIKAENIFLLREIKRLVDAAPLSEGKGDPAANEMFTKV